MVIVAHRHRPLKFRVGGRLFICVSPMKGLSRFRRRGKLSPRYIGPVEILGRVSDVAYKLALPSAFSSIQLVFHVSILRRYVFNESHVLRYDSNELYDCLNFVEKTFAILNRYV
ncbi:hypothetical protein MTR67_018174 [Solanum verrucosum]|uniref:Tf2-1-like SH3-like domain-containing protein n=1 Tax=Solanum verrucosum TaxID=315347 RepID=A0AAF0TMG6_SOLVR|nr:hypothetical protein MTR67_018174 [Solanum verrucosum]